MTTNIKKITTETKMTTKHRKITTVTKRRTMTTKYLPFPITLII